MSLYQILVLHVAGLVRSKAIWIFSLAPKSSEVVALRKNSFNWIQFQKSFSVLIAKVVNAGGVFATNFVTSSFLYPGPFVKPTLSDISSRTSLEHFVNKRLLNIKTKLTIRVTSKQTN